LLTLIAKPKICDLKEAQDEAVIPCKL